MALTLAVPTGAEPGCAGDAHPLVIAHRGSMFARPENTLAAFAWAADIGADMVELDVRFTADRHPVVIHDKTVDRTTDGRGSVDQMSLAALRSLNTRARLPIPTLDEALAFSRNSGMPVLIDLKDERPDAARIVDAIRASGTAHRITVGVHSVPVLHALRQAAQGLKLATLALVPDQDEIDAFLGEDVDIVRLWARWIANTPALVGRVSAADACIWVTTGRLKDEQLRRVVEHGAQGLITDYPELALKLRN